MSLQAKQAKAQEIFDEGNVQRVNKDTFVCHGSNGNQYEIKVNKDPQYNYGFYCKCPAWKFDTTRECKHVLAVKLLQKSKQTVNPSMQQKAMNAKVGHRRRSSGGYKVQKTKEKCETELENKGRDGKNKPLRFDKNGKLIIQYSEKVTSQIDDSEDYDE